MPDDVRIETAAHPSEPAKPRVVAITGGSGFIGRHLVATHVAAGDTVRVLSRSLDPRGVPSDVQVFIADLTRANQAELRAFADGADVLYHCAGELRDRKRMSALHVGGTARLLAAAAGRIGTWVQLSSVGVYGPKRDGIVSEDAPMQPAGIYEMTKAASDDLVLGRAAFDGLDVAIVRPSIVIGAGMPSRSLWSMFGAIERGAFTFIGRPGASANYVPVREVVAALQAAGAARRTRARSYNVSQWTTIEDFVSTICRLIGAREPTRRIPEWMARAVAQTAGRAPGFPLTPGRVNALTNFASYSTERLTDELGHSPTTTIADALAEVVAEWRYARQGAAA